MTYRFVLCCLLWAVLTGGCANTLENYKAKTPDETQILVALMRIPNGIRARSVDTILLAYADDAFIGNFHKNIGILSPAGKTTMKKQDLRYVYTDLFKNTKDLVLDVKDFQLTVSGDVAVAQGFTELVVKIEGGKYDKRENTIVNQVLWRLRRTPYGWRILEEIYQ